jgi:hypothetical protein
MSSRVFILKVFDDTAAFAVKFAGMIGGGT